MAVEHQNPSLDTFSWASAGCEPLGRVLQGHAASLSRWCWAKPQAQAVHAVWLRPLGDFFFTWGAAM